MLNLCEKMLPPLNVENAAQYQRTTLIAPRKGSGLPSNHRLKMVRLSARQRSVPLQNARRAVRRRSSTQAEERHPASRKCHLSLETLPLRCSLAPIMYAAPSAGAAHYSVFRTTCTIGAEDAHPRARDTRSRSVRILADWNLKPSNLVYREKPLTVKFIDFVRDFCEWRPFSSDNEFLERAPVLSFMQTLAMKNTSSTESAKKLYTELIFHTMILMLSSNIAFSIDNSRTASRQACAQGKSLNFMATTAQQRHDLSGARVSKEVLRQRGIRGRVENVLRTALLRQVHF